MSRFRVVRCANSEVKPVIVADHYLRQWPDPRALPFSYRLLNEAGPEMGSRAGVTHAPDGRPWGIVVVSLLQHHRQRSLFGYEGLPTCWQVLNLARVWVHPALQNVEWIGADRSGEVRRLRLNAFSAMVGAVLRRIQRDWLEFHGVRYLDQPYHIERIVSYCDRAHHQGVGYRASGFEKWGETSDGTKDVYVRKLKCPRWSYEPAQLELNLLTAEIGNPFCIKP